ncbi:GNAT family N-acetyltransferase [Chryseobacterium nematophagum]|uniref:GNAT family N-acetyltransferase n=1 Tax=Chryseobacterium nematophagum TaxID=2305228 RepID=A0A3M7LB96_9FLAO|nr:GNAT family N-acetyltransferase [Chryseobacterium nematophagum]RMZ59315.1 GNAT family N-acetyltransferase [Chryseobacterium nematophagum]
MKKDLIVSELNDARYLEEIVTMHRDIFLGTELYGKLMYFDENFPDYFKKVLESKNDYIVGVFKGESIMGFLHLKKIEKTLFLNNIFFKEEIRGGGIGTDTLREVLTKPFVTLEGFEYLELDVFESNVLAKKWYNKLGLLDISTSDWYFLQSNKKEDFNGDFKINEDINNFKSLYYNDHKVATFINDSYIIAHDTVALQYKSSAQFIYRTVKNENAIVNNMKFDSSTRMRGNISSIIDKIQCLISK